MATTRGELTNREYQSKKYLIRNIIDLQTWVELSKLIAPILYSEFFMNFTTIPILPNLILFIFQRRMIQPIMSLCRLLMSLMSLNIIQSTQSMV